MSPFTARPWLHKQSVICAVVYRVERTNAAGWHSVCHNRQSEQSCDVSEVGTQLPQRFLRERTDPIRCASCSWTRRLIAESHNQALHIYSPLGVEGLEEGRWVQLFARKQGKDLLASQICQTALCPCVTCLLELCLLESECCCHIFFCIPILTELSTIMDTILYPA